MTQYSIGGTKIGPGFSPYVIGELSGNHGGELENARRLIKRAKMAGASAVKTQCYTPNTITLEVNRPEFIVKDGLWKGRSLWELYAKAHTPFDWHPALYQQAKDSGIMIFSSVFDRSAVDFLEKLNCPAYKIASMEIGDTVLIEHAASTGKPLIISTGMASTEEIINANEASGGKAAFLHCMSEYPGTIETSNLGGIKNLQTLLPNNVIGISDHTPGSLIPIAATALGACIIEKHFGHLPGVVSEDDQFSMNAGDFGNMVEQVKQAWGAMQHRPLEKNPTLQMKRSLYATAYIAKGELFSDKNVRSVIPVYGLAPKHYNQLMGKLAQKSYSRGDPIQDIELR